MIKTICHQAHRKWPKNEHNKVLTLYKNHRSSSNRAPNQYMRNGNKDKNRSKWHPQKLMTDPLQMHWKRRNSHKIISLQSHTRTSTNRKKERRIGTLNRPIGQSKSLATRVRTVKIRWYHLIKWKEGNKSLTKRRKHICNNKIVPWCSSSHLKTFTLHPITIIVQRTSNSRISHPISLWTERKYLTIGTLRVDWINQYFHQIGTLEMLLSMRGQWHLLRERDQQKD